MLSSPFVSATDFSAAIIQNPLTVSPETTVMAAMTLMSGMQPANASESEGECEDPLEDPLFEIRLSCVLVLEGDRLLGLLTNRDVLRLSVQGKALDSLRVSQVMVPPVLTLQESECRDEFSLASRLKPHNVRHVPILDDQHRVVGLLIPERVQHKGTFYEALAAACPVGIFRTDTAGCCIYVNTRWCQIAGLQGKEAMGFGWIEGLHPEDRDRVMAEWTASVEHNRPFELEYRFQNGEGQTTWVYGQSVAERGSTGEIVGYVGTLTDISDRQRTQYALELQIELDRLVAGISSRFIQHSSQDTTDSINQALQEIGEFTQVDSSYIFQYSETEPLHSMTYEWAAPGVTPQLQNCQNLPLDMYPWATDLLQNGEIVYVSNSDVLPPEAAIDQHSFRHFGVKSCLAIPLIAAQHQVKGFVGFVSFHKTHLWSEDNIRLLKIFADILMNTLKRQAVEAELKTSEERLRLALRATNLGLYDLNLKTGEAIVTPEYATMLGYDPITFRETNAKWVERLHPEDQARVTHVYQAYITGEIPDYQVEFRQRAKNSDWKWILSIGKIVAWDEEDRPLRMLGTHTDISDRKQTEAEHLRSVSIQGELKLLEQILDVVLAGYWDWDIPSNQEYLSPGFKQMFGYQDEELPNRPETWQNLIFEEDLPGVLDCFDRHVQSHGEVPYYNEVRYRHKDGSTVWVICCGKVIEWDTGGNPIRIIGCHIDITARKLAEADLIQNRDLREAIFNELADALFLVDVETLLTLHCNQRAVELFGVADRAELIGIEGHTLQRYQFSEEALADIADQIQVQGFWSQELEFVTRQGNFFWGNIAAKPIVVAGNTMNLVRVTDISDRKRAEKTLEQTAIQLAATNRELESFSYSVSHDLRAPLRHMSGFVNALKKQLENHQILENPKVAHYLEVIESSSEKMAQLIDGLLSLSRIGRRPMAWQPVPLQDLVETAIALNQPKVGNDRPSVEFKIGELPTLLGDATLLQQVFQNLIGNAIKFSRNAVTPRVEIGSEPDGTVWVKDNGAGFQMEYADKLFSAFQRLHTQVEFEGTGIGLAIVQRIVQRHGGTIWAEGTPQQGATFYLKLGGQNPSLH